MWIWCLFFTKPLSWNFSLQSKTRVTRVQTRINDFHTVTKLFDAPTFINPNKKIPAGQIISRRLPSSRSGSRLDLTWLEERGSRGRGNRWFVILIRTNWNVFDMSCFCMLYVSNVSLCYQNNIQSNEMTHEV